MTYDPSKNPTQHRAISSLGGKASAKTAAGIAQRRAAARAGGLATKGISKNQGEDHGQHKLTEQDVLEIRSIPADQMTSGELAPLFGVSAAQIRRVRGRVDWAWLEDGGEHEPK